MNRYQKRIDEERTQCLLCPRRCELTEGKRGFCHVRQNVGGEITLTTYGYNTGLATDPIEKKPLYHFLPGSNVLSFGTLGCNMGCPFCQNWSISKSKRGNEQLQQATPEAIAQVAAQYHCESVAFTYNEPFVFFEYAVDTARECHRHGIKTVAVTAGYMNPGPRAEFFREMDAVNIDLKAFNPKFYERNCQAKLDVVLDTIQYVAKETNVWLELTTLLIEGENDSEEDIREECLWIADNLGTSVPLHFSAFHPAWKWNDRRATSPNTLIHAYHIAKDVGLNHVYTGNIVHPETSMTYCEHCERPIIKREGYQTEICGIRNGHCAFCGDTIAGVFSR